MSIDNIIFKLVPFIDGKFRKRGLLNYDLSRGTNLVWFTNDSIRIHITNAPGQTDIVYPAVKATFTFRCCEGIQADSMDYPVFLDIQVNYFHNGYWVNVITGTAIYIVGYGFIAMTGRTFDGCCDLYKVPCLNITYPFSTKVTYQDFIDAFSGSLSILEVYPFTKVGNLTDIEVLQHPWGYICPPVEPLFTCTDEVDDPRLLAYHMIDNLIVTSSISDTPGKTLGHSAFLDFIQTQEFMTTVEIDLNIFQVVQIFWDTNIPNYYLITLDYKVTPTVECYPVHEVKVFHCPKDVEPEELLCDDLYPGVWFALSWNSPFDSVDEIVPLLPPIRFADPGSIFSNDMLMYAIIVALVAVVPGITITDVTYDFDAGEINIELIDAVIYFKYVSCPCPVNTKWSKKYSKCVADCPPGYCYDENTDECILIP